MNCNVIDPITRQSYDRDPRWIARKAELYVKNSGLADTAFFGAEAEFFIFDNVRFDQNTHSGFYFIDAEEGRWNSGRRENNLGYRPRYKEGYFPVPPTDHHQDLRAEMVETMGRVGLDIECHHHEVATAGQCEIDQRFNTLLQVGRQHDAVQVRDPQHGAISTARRVTFMPKPLFGDNGSGMHMHQSLWKGGKPLFAGDLYAGLSQMALWYIGGLLKHARALAAIIAPTTNSYKRLVPGYEAPVNLAYSQQKSLGGVPHSDVLGLAQSQARRVPAAGSVVESVSGVRGDGDGGARRRAEQDRSGRAAGQGHLRSVAGRDEGRAVHAVVARRSA